MSSVSTEISLQERILVSVSERGDTSDTNFETSLNEINWTGGGKDFDQDALVNGGQHKNYSPQEPMEFEGTLYVKGVSKDDARGIAELFEGNELNSASGNKAYGPSLDRKDLRFVVMASEDPAASGATSASSAEYDAFRWMAQNAEIISAEHNFDDRTLQVEFTAKINPFTPSRTLNWRYDENKADVGSGLDSVAAYDDSFDIKNPSGA